MNKVHRDGVDIKVAFSSTAKCLVRHEASLNHCSNYTSLNINSSHSSDIDAPVQAWIKKFLRPVARRVYHLLKPFIRPLAFRFREYLLAGLRLDLQRMVADFPLSSEAEVKSAEQYGYASTRRTTINCGQDAILVKSEVGYVLCPASDHLLLVCLIEGGELERGTRQVIQRFLKPGDVFVDVGANIGLHTLAAARAMQGRGKIFAFEPYAPTQRLLEKSVWFNGFSEMTEIHQVAISNRKGQQTLFLGAVSGHHSLFALETPSSLSEAPVEVPIARLDDMIQKTKNLSLMKIDVEGAELEVLESARTFIESNPDLALIVEFGPSHLKRVGHSVEQWFSAFSQLGLVYRAINENTGLLEDWSLERLMSGVSTNLFFARPNSKSWANV